LGEWLPLKGLELLTQWCNPRRPESSIVIPLHHNTCDCCCVVQLAASTVAVIDPHQDEESMEIKLNSVIFGD